MQQGQPLIMDLCITHERYGSSDNLVFNGTLYFPNAHDVDKQLANDFSTMVYRAA